MAAPEPLPEMLDQLEEIADAALGLRPGRGRRTAFRLRLGAPVLQQFRQRLAQRHLLLAADVVHLVQRHVADAAARHVDNPQKRRLVVRVRNQLQIADDVLHLGALEEVLAAVDHVGNARLPEGDFKRL